MPAPERSMGIDGRAIDGEPTRNQRQHREAMARNSPPQAPRPGPHPQQPGRSTSLVRVPTPIRRNGARTSGSMTMTRLPAIAPDGC